MIRVAVVDLGTNSTRLLVAEPRGEGDLHQLAHADTITRLGESVDAARRLTNEAMERVRTCAHGYLVTARELGACKSVAVATSAVRDAANGPEFLECLSAELGIATRLLSGQEEALLTFHGARVGRGFREPALVVDVGGGSTELTVGTDAAVDFQASIDVGSVRLTERCLRSDPRLPEEVAAAGAIIRGALAETDLLAARPQRAVGVAGTLTTLAAIDLEVDADDTMAVDGHRLSLPRIEAEVERLAATSVAELRTLRGLHRDRAPVIAAGALCVREVLRFAGLHEIEVSVRDLLHGAALELCGGEGSSARPPRLRSPRDPA